MDYHLDELGAVPFNCVEGVVVKVIFNCSDILYRDTFSLLCQVCIDFMDQVVSVNSFRLQLVLVLFTIFFFPLPCNSSASLPSYFLRLMKILIE